MKEIAIYLALALLLMFSFQGIASDQPGTPSASAGEKFDAKKEKIKQQLSNSLRDLDDKIKELRADAIESKGQIKADLETQIKNLEKDKNNLKKKFVELESATGQAWDDLKLGLDSGIEKLKESYTKAKTRFSEQKK